MLEDGNAPSDPAEAEIANILAGTSDTDTADEASQMPVPQEGAAQTQGTPQQPQGFSFGGRVYKTKEEAEKAHNSLYGKFSGQQSILNQLRSALKNPKRLQELAQDPEWSEILGKLGVREMRDQYQQEQQAASQRGPDYSKLPPELQGWMREQGQRFAAHDLEREEWGFEKKLGRSVTDEEHNSVMKIIGRIGDLTYEEAWKLAFHDRLLKEAGAKAQTAASSPKGHRPLPVAGFIPGVKLNLKKPVQDMSKAEWREYVKGSEEFKNLTSRG